MKTCQAIIGEFVFGVQRCGNPTTIQIESDGEYFFACTKHLPERKIQMIRTVIKFNAPNTTDGAPRRVFLITSPAPNGRTITEHVVETLEGNSDLDGMAVASVKIPAGEFNRLVK